MNDNSQIIRPSIRLQKLIAYANLENTPKLMLGMICQHHNDSSGYAHPSEDLLALLCNMCRRTVQRYLKALSDSGLLLIKRIPGLRCNAYVIQEQALEAIKLQRPNLAASIFSENEPVDNFAAKLKLAVAKGDISSAKGDISSAKGDISSAKGDTQMSHRTVLNGIELKRTDEAVATKKAAVHNSAPAKSAKRAEQPSSSSFFEELQTPAEQEALANWQLTRIAKKKSALPTPLQCKLLVEQARSIGKPLGWVVQVMALNDWANFDKSWLQNVRPAPKLPMEEAPVIAKPAPQAHNAPTVARAPVPNPCPATPAQVPAKQDGGGAEGDVPEGLAKTRALLAEMKKSMAPAKPVAGRADGKQTWVEKIEKARRGEYVGKFALESACKVLGLNYAALKAEIKAETVAA